MMKKAIGRFGTFLGYIAFLLVIFAGYKFTAPFSLDWGLPLLFKALFAAFLAWLGGVIVGDIMMKGVVDDIDREALNPSDGGIEQRIVEAKAEGRVILKEEKLPVEESNKANKKRTKDKK